MPEVATVRPLRGLERAAADRRFRKAARHSAHIRLLRIAIPIFMVVSVGGVILATMFNPLTMLERLPIDPGKIVVSGTKVTMHAPRVAGYTKDARPYEMTAEVAAQDLTKPDLLELEKIHSRIEMQDKGVVVVTADNGLYDRKLDELTLTNHIRMTSTSGMEALLSQAVVYVKKGALVSQQPVTVNLANGVVNGNGLEVDDNGEVIRFVGGVTMNVTPAAADQKAAAR